MADHSFQLGRSPRPTVWAALAWNGESYLGTVTAQESRRWYFSINIAAPVPAMESDQGVGYGGPRYALGTCFLVRQLRNDSVGLGGISHCPFAPGDGCRLSCVEWQEQNTNDSPVFSSDKVVTAPQG